MSDSLDLQQNTTAAPPAESYAYTPRWVMIAFLVAFGVIGYLLYAMIHQKQQDANAFSNAAKRSAALTAELDKTNASIADLKAQLQVTEQKLGLTEDELASARSLAVTVGKEEKQQRATANLLREQLGQVQQQTSSQYGQLSDQLNGTKSDVAGTRQDLDDARTKLTTAMGDLGVQSGLIARNHEEVQELKRLGERNIYEFKMGKEKIPQHVGPIELQVRKIDSKHFRFTLDIIADDRRVERKDKTIEEPIQFYTRGSRGLYEIVVYDVNKRFISGYLSTPKIEAPANPSAPSGN
jgi:hypothetical protein